MHRFDRMHLSPEAALRALDATDLEEKLKLAEGIALIAVVDHRRDYLAAGYSCMRDYCTQHLRMSEDQAFRRIQVARVALRVPDIFEHLADGRLSLATASVLAPHLSPESASELLAGSAFKSREEILRMIAERSRPLEAQRMVERDEQHVETSPGSLAPGQVNSLSAPCAQTSVVHDVAGPRTTAPVDNPRRGRVHVNSAGAHEVRLTLTRDEHDDLRRALDLLSHAVPSGDPAVVYARAMKLYIAHLEKRRLGAKRDKPATRGAPRAGSLAPGQATTPEREGAPRGSKAPVTGRGIPKRLRRLVWERDGGRCTFVGTDGHRCGSTRLLQYDHVVPVAQGGEPTLANLRLLCRPHNQFEAERVLGKQHVRDRRELAQRDRVRAKVAARAETARARSAAATGAVGTIIGAKARTAGAKAAKASGVVQAGACAAAAQHEPSSHGDPAQPGQTARHAPRAAVQSPKVELYGVGGGSSLGA